LAELVIGDCVMPDDKNKTAADRRRINLHETYELGYWSRKFGVTPQELAEAVQKVGPSAEAVARELHR
jgi:hypothetical protein